ncbi:MAG: hypothetical protein V7708_14385 [Oceanicoccus sp.]
MRFTGSPYIVLGVILALVFSVSTVFLIYQPGLDGSFLLDDRHNIELNEDIQINDLSLGSISAAWNGGKTGGLGRPISSLSFALTQFFMDGSAYSYKLTNVVLHVLNMLLVMGFVTSLLRFWRDTQQLVLSGRQIVVLAGIIGFLWALHPLQVSTVLYAVQRMTILSSLFTVAALWLYTIWRTQLHKEGILRWIAPFLISILVALGVLSKENAILFFGFIGLLEFFSYKQLRLHSVDRLFSNAFWAISVVAVVFAIAYIHFFQNWYAGSYQARNFDLTDRLMTQSRVIFIYLQWILFPSIDQYGLFHDDIAISRGLLSPVTTIFSLFGLLGLTSIALALRRTLPWLGYGIGFYLVGHVLEGSIVPLELVFEHRNYLPSLGVLIILVITIFRFFQLVSASVSISAAIAIIVFIFFASMTYLRSLEWSSYSGQLTAAVERHPNSARTHWAMGIWYLQNHSEELFMGLDNSQLYDDGKYYALKAADIDKAYVSSYLGLMLFHYQNDRPFPELWLYEVGDRLSAGIYRNETDDYFRQLVKCFQLSGCFASEQEIEYLFERVLSNSALVDSVRGNLLSRYSAFHYHMSDLSGSAKLLVEAMDVAPSVIGYRNLTVLALEMNDEEMAVNYMKVLKSMPGSSDLEELERLDKLVLKCCNLPLPEKEER